MQSSKLCKEIQDKICICVIGVNAENKSWWKDDGFIVLYILNVSGNVFPVN